MLSKIVYSKSVMNKLYSRNNKLCYTYNAMIAKKLYKDEKKQERFCRNKDFCQICFSWTKVSRHRVKLFLNM